MNDKEIIRNYGWIVGSSDNLKEFENALKNVRQDERKIIIQLLKTKEMRCKGHGENCDWNNAIDFVIKKLSAKDD
jgi:hypothetical protein